MDAERLRVDVGQKSSGNVGRILGIFVQEKTLVNADFTRKRIGNLDKEKSEVERGNGEEHDPGTTIGQ